MVEIRKFLGLGRKEEELPIVKHPETPEPPKVEGVQVHPGEHHQLETPVVQKGEILVENAGEERMAPPKGLKRPGGPSESGTWLWRFWERQRRRRQSESQT